MVVLEGKGVSLVQALDFKKWKSAVTGKQVQTTDLVFRMFANWTVSFLISLALICFLFQTTILGEDSKLLQKV